MCVFFGLLVLFVISCCSIDVLLNLIVLAGGSHGSFHGNLIVICSFNNLSSTIEQPEQQYHSQPVKRVRSRNSSLICPLGSM
uniref:Secreted protein n=1 Tax=Helianthus annuus TaxID=4232 RepID=A0A251SZJ5_HELAN